MEQYATRRVDARGNGGAVLVYPCSMGSFKSGESVVSTLRDGDGKVLVLSASSIPKKALGLEGRALIVPNPRVEAVDGSKILYAKPETVKIRGFMPQDPGAALLGEDGAPFELPPMARKDPSTLPRSIAQRTIDFRRGDGAEIVPLREANGSGVSEDTYLGLLSELLGSQHSESL